jgi:predicted alpha/beta-hydrolase family hydrolase
MSEARKVPVGDEEVTALYYRGEQPFGTLILAHGAGADQRHPFMKAWAQGLAARGLDVVTFNFRYTEAKRGAPDKNDALERCWRAVAETARTWETKKPLALGGKSMGGRIASQIAPSTDCTALVFLGYPLHPPKKPSQLRVAHWPRIAQPALFVQGTRDPFGSPDELRAHFGSLRATVIAVEGGDHSFAVPKKLGGADDEKLRDRVADWLRATMRG